LGRRFYWISGEKTRHQKTSREKKNVGGNTNELTKGLLFCVFKKLKRGSTGSRERGERKKESGGGGEGFKALPEEFAQRLEKSDKKMAGLKGILPHGRELPPPRNNRDKEKELSGVVLRGGDLKGVNPEKTLLFGRGVFTWKKLDQTGKGGNPASRGSFLGKKEGKTRNECL